MARTVVIVRTGTANVASVAAAIGRIGCRPIVTDDASVVTRAGMLILPGVGSFAAITSALDDAGLRSVLAERVAAGRPTLAICLGFQVLFRESAESPGVRGLGVIDARVGRFVGRAGVRVPQMGWNRVDAPAGAHVLRSGDAYFAHTFRVAAADWGARGDWVCAEASHGDSFVAAMERAEGRVVACQCHPELSGAWGRGLLERWVACAAEGVAAC